MGLYINAPEMGSLGKSKVLIDNYGARRLTLRSGDIEPNEVVVCVVNNGPFEAAGVITDSNEMEDFSDPTDLRPKDWLLMDRDKVKELVGVDF